MKRLVFAFVLIGCAASAFAQTGVDSSQLSKPPTDSWPTYNGDYSGRRFSPLKEITDSNVQSLSLAWMYRLGGGGPRGGAPGGSIKATSAGERRPVLLAPRSRL